MSTMSQKQRARMSKDAYGMAMDMGLALKCARLASGIHVDFLAKCMGVNATDWVEYERNHKPIPGYIIIKLMIFGMDFWARNKACFENITNVDDMIKNIAKSDMELQ